MASPSFAQSLEHQAQFALLLIAVLIFGITSPSHAQTVSISQPANNSTVSTSVRVVAKASDSNGISYTQIYVDGKAAYTVHSASLDTTVNLSAGAHRIAVQATDNLGNIGKSVINVTATTLQSGTPTVTINQPANNSTVSTSVRVVANAADTNGISYTQIYVDGSSKYTVRSNYVDTTLSLSSGTHRIAVQATDKLGNAGKSVAYVTATSTAGSTTDLTTISRIEESSEWQTCGNCGNSGATGQTATYSMTRGITSPSTDGSSSLFSIDGPYPYKNGYWYIGHSGSPTKPVQYLRYEFDIYVPSKYVNAPQAIEFECQQKANGYVYNFAWQANYARNEWRIFDYVLRRWDSTGIPLTRFSGDKWHHVITEYHTDGTTVVHDSITIDGVKKTVGIKHPALYVGGTSHYLTNAFQLDLNGSATPYKLYVDGMKVSYK